MLKRRVRLFPRSISLSLTTLIFTNLVMLPKRAIVAAVAVCFGLSLASAIPADTERMIKRELPVDATGVKPSSPIPVLLSGTRSLARKVSARRH